MAYKVFVLEQIDRFRDGSRGLGPLSFTGSSGHCLLWPLQSKLLLRQHKGGGASNIKGGGANTHVALALALNFAP